MPEQPHQTAPIFKLPPELIDHILSYLSAEHLVSLLGSCRELAHHASNDTLWLTLLKDQIPHNIPNTPHPFPSYHALYLSLHPYWFLPRHKIWFSDDDAYNGKLIVAKHHLGSLYGFRLTATRPTANPQTWSLKPTVIIHHVDVRVYISTSDPIIHIPPTLRHSLTPSSELWTPSTDLRMRVGRPEQKINADLMLAKTIDAAPNTSVWPPRTIPNMPRSRSSAGGNDASVSHFTAKGHRPANLGEISQTTFRLRTWSQYTQGMLSLGVRLGEEVSTWSTLLPELYTPTPAKPYQGLFVGDYASHGCEFLLVLQTEKAPPRPRPLLEPQADYGEPTRQRNYLQAVLDALRDQQHIDDEDMMSLQGRFGEEQRAQREEEQAEEGERHGAGLAGSSTNRTQATHSTMTTAMSGSVEANVPDLDGSIHQGAIEAIKLTGDVNVPRGEHTFIADDIGARGFIRIAHEEPFRGARVVKSRGHVAARGFREDEFIPSQLFLINPDLLAQYWLPFGHISFYKRVDLDGLLKEDIEMRRASEQPLSSSQDFTNSRPSH